MNFAVIAAGFLYWVWAWPRQIDRWSAAAPAELAGRAPGSQATVREEQGDEAIEHSPDKRWIASLRSAMTTRVSRQRVLNLSGPTLLSPVSVARRDWRHPQRAARLIQQRHRRASNP